MPERSWKLGPYLDYWLGHVIKPTRRPATYALYEMIVRIHMAPALGKYHLKRLSVPIVQAFLNGKLRAGLSVRMFTSCARCSAPRCPVPCARN